MPRTALGFVSISGKGVRGFFLGKGKHQSTKPCAGEAEGQRWTDVCTHLHTHPREPQMSLHFILPSKKMGGSEKLGRKPVMGRSNIPADSQMGAVPVVL